MIARKSFLIVVAQFLVRLFGWVGLLVLAKLWGGFAPVALGMIGFATAFIGLFSVIADLGFGQAHIKRISEGQDLGTCIGTYAAIKAVLITIMVLSILGSMYIAEFVLHMNITDASTTTVILIFLIYYVLQNLQHISVNTFNARGEIAKMQITTMFENVVKVPLMILVVLAGVSMSKVPIAPRVHWPDFLTGLQQFLYKHSLGALAMAYVLGIFTSILVGFWLLRKYPLKKPSWPLTKNYFIFAFPLLLTSILSTLSANIDKIMIGYFWTATEVGYYFSLQQILQIFLIISFSFNTVLFPAFSEYHARKDYISINEITHLAERYISMVIIPIAVVTIIFVHPVITIMLNSAFLPAASTLVILTIYAIITSFMAPYFCMMSGLNKPGFYAITTGVICGINIVLNFLLIPSWGLLSPLGINGPAGAGVATVCSTFAGFIALKIMAKKLTGIKYFQTHTPRHIIAGFGMGLVLYGVNLIIPVTRWYQLIVFAFLGLAVYLLVLYVLKEFNKKDFKFFLNLVHPKEMFNYIKSEIRDDELRHKK